MSDSDLEDAGPRRISFFTGTDEEVCRAFWNIFVKRSHARGIDCRSKASIAATKSRARREAMAAKKQGQLLSTVLEAYRAFEEESGRAPTAQELFDEIGAGVGKSVKNVASAIYRLRMRGEVGAAPSKAKAKTATTAHRADPAPTPAHRADPAPSSADPMIATLIAKRDEYRRKADALDVAIEALR